LGSVGVGISLQLESESEAEDTGLALVSTSLFSLLRDLLGSGTALPVPPVASCSVSRVKNAARGLGICAAQRAAIFLFLLGNLYGCI